jgi:hypothetical protein
MTGVIAFHVDDMRKVCTPPRAAEAIHQPVGLTRIFHEAVAAPVVGAAELSA